jgi:formylglycine-generating enzyme required for sulfatase activity
LDSEPEMKIPDYCMVTVSAAAQSLDSAPAVEYALQPDGTVLRTSGTPPEPPKTPEDRFREGQQKQLEMGASGALVDDCARSLFWFRTWHNQPMPSDEKLREDAAKAKADLDEIDKMLDPRLVEGLPKPPAMQQASLPSPPPPTVGAGTTKVNPKDGLTYVQIPPGRFTMGCSPGYCDDNEKPAHEVTITRGFWLGRTPVTQQAYQRVTGQNPSHFKGANLPVEEVNWNEAKSYCEAIGGRLPTEAEWEYAARAGSTAARYGNPDEIAWYSENSGGTTHEVGQKRANAFGLYDMLGNVWQWVADWSGNYESGAQNDPSGAGSGQYRALRGGSWNYDARFARVSYRGSDDPGARGRDLGLRCVGE